MKLKIDNEDPSSKDSMLLMEELSSILKGITGDSGVASFSINDLKNKRSCFLIARDEFNQPLGCGSIRPLENEDGEIKRMYSKRPGIGLEILKELERRAAILGYKFLKLETRKINTKAVNFYLKNGYEIIENYGKYKGNEKAVCFEKSIPSAPFTK